MRKPSELTGSQRRQLRALAHYLCPVVQVGRKGVTDEVVDAITQALNDHELIKVRVHEGAPLSRDEVASLLAERAEAHDIGPIGRIVILYRRHPEHPQVPLQS